MKRLVVFIYGSKGSDRKFGKYFPNLLGSDPQLSELYRAISFQCHIDFIKYFLSNKKVLIEALTHRFRKKLNHTNKEDAQVAFICHGIGGLVARQYMVEGVTNRQSLNVDRVLLFAVPNNKPDLSRLYDVLSWKDVAEKSICKHPDIVDRLNTSFTANSLKEKVAMKYVLGDLDNVIDTSNALDQWGTGYYVSEPKKDHWSIFKPKSHDDSTFLIAKRFLLAEAPAQKKYPENLVAIADVLNWELDTNELESARNDIIDLVDLLNQLQWRSRQLLCALIQKADQVSYDEMLVEPSTIYKSMNLTAQELKAELAFLKKYELIDFIGISESEKIHLRWPNEKWLIWDQLRGFCQKAGIGLKRLIVDLQFDLLDSKEK